LVLSYPINKSSSTTGGVPLTVTDDDVSVDDVDDVDDVTMVVEGEFDGDVETVDVDVDVEFDDDDGTDGGTFRLNAFSISVADSILLMYDSLAATASNYSKSFLSNFGPSPDESLPVNGFFTIIDGGGGVVEKVVPDEEQQGQAVRHHGNGGEVKKPDPHTHSDLPLRSHGGGGVVKKPPQNDEDDGLPLRHHGGDGNSKKTKN